MKISDVEYIITPASYDDEGPFAKRIFIKHEGRAALQYFYFLDVLNKLNIVDVRKTQHAFMQQAHYIEVCFFVK